MTTQTTPLPGLPRLNLEVIMGPALIGVCLASTFYLLTCQLTYKYFARFGEDAWYYKLSHKNNLSFPRPSLRAIRNFACDPEHFTDNVGAEYCIGDCHAFVGVAHLRTWCFANRCSRNIIMKVWSFSDHKKAIPL
ncbi:hypothetical protein BD410DRAFT_831779, partial [Rickenella mellea]